MNDDELADLLRDIADRNLDEEWEERAEEDALQDLADRLREDAGPQLNLWALGSRGRRSNVWIRAS